MANVTLENLSKTFPGPVPALRDLSLTIRSGELLVLLGPSGCGKSTLLRVLAGLETPDSGRVLFDGQDVTPLPPQARDVAMVFQSCVLYPHMSVRANLAFPLKARREAKPAVASQVAAMAKTLEIEPLLERLPSQLSGGQRQRVALGKALIRRPRLFLLDEPLSSLDGPLRLQMRRLIKRLHAQTGTTTVYVTHDQEEAFALGERLAILSAGRIEQLGTPAEIYRRPASRFVASFASTRIAYIAAKVSHNGQATICIADQHFALPPDACCGTGCGVERGAGVPPVSNMGVSPMVTGNGIITLGLRPEMLHVGLPPQHTRYPLRLRGTLSAMEHKGGAVMLSVDIPDVGELTAEARLNDLPQEKLTDGEPIDLWADMQETLFFHE